MRGIHGAPHHVGYQIQIAEVVKEKSVVEMLEHVSVLVPVLLGNKRRLPQEIFVVENS